METTESLELTKAPTTAEPASIAPAPAPNSAEPTAPTAASIEPATTTAPIDPPDPACRCGAPITKPDAKLCDRCGYQAGVELAEARANEAEYWREYAETHDGSMRKRFTLDHYDGRNT